MESENQVKYYVGVGASAGGLEALELLFSNMPAETGMAFIVIQHLSPDYKSLMVELLSKRTEVEVKRAEDNMLIEPNKIYLIPPKKNLSIFHGKLLLSDLDHSKGINLPIDFFLRSLAEDQGEKSIAVILSGTGSDGVKGIRAVKEAGGMVMVQSEESAKFDGMPKSAISTGLADFIMPPELMPKTLLSFLNSPYSNKADTPQSLLSDEDGLTRIYALLREKNKVDFTFYKPSTIVRRIERRMTVNQINDLKEYVRLLETQTGELVILFKELLIGVTNFFRDKEVFDELTKNYIPKIFATGNKNEIRFWVAGCSTGEEAYSLAIICREYMERIGKMFDVKIFATDIDKDAIMYASNGFYPEAISVDVPPNLLTKYFHHKENQYQIDRSIREMVVFAQHNIIKDPPFTNIDLVSCRNLLIYFQPVLQKRVMELFNFSLKPNGILVLGTSETVGDMVEYFNVLNNKDKIYGSKGRKNPGAIGSDFSINSGSRPSPNRIRVSGGVGLLRMHEEERLLERVLDSFVGEFIKLAIVVNEQLEILHIIGDTTSYFYLPPGKITNDISKVAQKELAIPLATGIQNIFKSNEELHYNNVRLQRKDEVKIINLHFKLLPAKKGQVPLAIVIIEEGGIQKIESTKKPGLNYDINQGVEDRIHDLEQELQFTRENLQATIEELETSNEELQATNEELLASNEELQSTNEELQSVNEELYTVNTEYQSKIIELTELNNDFDNLLESIKIGTIFLDENLELRKFTSETQKIFRIVNNDVGRPIDHLTHDIISVDPIEMIEEVERSGVEKDIEVNTKDGRWYIMRILPYKVGNTSYSGIIISFIDISKLKETQYSLSKSENKLESLYKASPIGVGVVKNRVFEEVNQYMCDLLQYTKDELLGKKTEMLYESHEDYLNIHKLINKQIKEYSTANIELNLVKKDKTSIPVLLSVSSMNHNEENGSRIITVLDMSVKLSAVNKAKELESQYKQLFDTMTTGVVYQDKDGTIVSANRAAQELLGLSLDQLMGRTSYDPRWKAIKPDGSEFKGEDHPAMVALRTGKTITGQVMGVYNPPKETFTWISIDAVPLFEEGGKKPYRVYTTFEDVTKSIEDDKKIISIQKQMEQVLQMSGVAWWIYDVINKKVEMSESRAKMIGYNLEETGADLEFWMSKIHKDDYKKFMNVLQKCIDGKTDTYSAEYRIKTKSGKWKKLKDTGRVVERGANGNAAKLTGIAMQIKTKKTS